MLQVSTTPKRVSAPHSAPNTGGDTAAGPAEAAVGIVPLELPVVAVTLPPSEAPGGTKGGRGRGHGATDTGVVPAPLALDSASGLPLLPIPLAVAKPPRDVEEDDGSRVGTVAGAVAAAIAAAPRVRGKCATGTGQGGG